jgi:hypothetical protein
MHKKAISLEEIFLELTRNKEPQSEMLNSNQKPEEEETC